MTIISSNLYESVLLQLAKNAYKLKVISGYGSVSFLEKIIGKFPNLLIDLYLGMTPQGISEQSHIGYLECTSQNENVKVFYQVENPVTHIKLYTFEYSDGSTISFVGSANFTENGFVNWNECLLKTSEDTRYLFDLQLKKSILCSDKDVEKYIEFFKEENSGSFNTNVFSQEGMNINTSSDIKKRNTRENFRSKIAGNSYNEFKIPVLFENMPSWKTDGVNAKFSQRQGYLTQSNAFPYRRIFPIEKEIIFETYDGKILHGFVPEYDVRRLIFKEDIHKYLAECMNHLFNEPISFNSLVQYGCKHLILYKISDNHYLLDFEPVQ
ncbi:phospholipase D family protein [Carnobacterium sp.]|uniref:phospholipase D family protein n=1 Tax=Carnobacterium sp. TaxID=48221 RepID=UPI002FC5E104